MTLSSFCLKQRQQEQEKLKRFLAVSLAGSAVLHGVLAVAFSGLYEKPQLADDPIELMIVEQPEVPKPRDEKLTDIPTPEPEPVKPPTPQQPREIKEPVETRLSSRTAPLKPKASAPPIPQPSPETRIPAPQTALPEPKPSPSSAPPATPPKPEARSQPAPQPSPLQSTWEQKPDFATPPRRGNVSEPTENSSQGSQQVGEGLRGDSAPSTSPNAGDGNANSTAPGTVATNRAPERPQPDGGGGVQCISNCSPDYPSILDGAEGSATVRVTIDQNGNLVNATVAEANSNSRINEQALIAARKMKFAPPSGGVSASVRYKITFTMDDSEFARTRERQEQERQAQLERERQARLERARQAQLERARQAELQRQQQPAGQEQPAQP